MTRCAITIRISLSWLKIYNSPGQVAIVHCKEERPWHMVHRLQSSFSSRSKLGVQPMGDGGGVAIGAIVAKGDVVLSVDAVCNMHIDIKMRLPFTNHLQ